MNDRKPEPESPNVPRGNDTAPGQALRRSLIVLLLIVLGVGGLLFFLEQAPAPQPRSGPSTADSSEAVGAIPNARFADVTSEAGIRFTHFNGAKGEKLLPETMGGGVSFLDFDNDGDQDLLFINSTSWPDNSTSSGPGTTAALYRNDSKGRFEDVTRGSGLDVPLYGMGTAVGDYDNDGLVDVFITAVGGNRLFHNDGNGHFSDATATSGIGGKPEDWSTSAAWFDYDNDGRLDLFVCNYVTWSRKIDLEVGNTLPGIGRAYGRPMNFSGSFPKLYHNDGNGRFTDVSSKSGVEVKNPSTGLPMAKSLGVAPVDLNDDGWIDLIVANDTVQNFVFTNRHDGTFREIGALSGVAFDTYGGARGAMGIDTARFQEDNSLGISIGNFANEMTAFYVSQPNSVTFADEAISQGIGAASKLSLTFGVFFFDYDLDGWLDLLTANGHIEEAIAQTQGNQQYRQPAQLFWNSRGANRTGGFVLVPPEKCGPDLVKSIVGRGSAFADIDGDGDLDVALTQINGPPLLLRNDQKLNHHWLRLKLVGSKSNRDAIGAWVKARVGGQTLWRQVMPTRSYLSQSELPVTFGLGSTDKVDELIVAWPDGSRQKVGPVIMDSLTVVQQTSRQ